MDSNSAKCVHYLNAYSGEHRSEPTVPVLLTNIHSTNISNMVRPSTEYNVIILKPRSAHERERARRAMLVYEFTPIGALSTRGACFPELPALLRAAVK
jgi:hypothetical protein